MVTELVGFFVNESLLVVGGVAIEPINFSLIEAAILDSCELDAFEDRRYVIIASKFLVSSGLLIHEKVHEVSLLGLLLHQRRYI